MARDPQSEKSEKSESKAKSKLLLLSTMPHQTKKQRLDEGGHQSTAAAADSDDFVASFDDLSIDELANIFGFLPLKDIMRLRRINKKAREGVKMTIPPMPRDFHSMFSVGSVKKYNAMRVMTIALPNLQQLKFGYYGWGTREKFSEGEDPDEEQAAETADWNSSDMEIISSFSKLRDLRIYSAPLNGRYPVLFNFPLLQILKISDCRYLKFDLDMISAGLPFLRELDCVRNECMTGNINKLRSLKHTLEKVTIAVCEVEGNFVDLADFPNLKKLHLGGPAFTGDVREIVNSDFPSLESLRLPKSVYGGYECELQRISDAPDLIRSLYLLKKQRPTLSMLGSWRGVLSTDSLDWYEAVDHDPNMLPFSIHFVKAGPRIGYQWSQGAHWCEVNWLDPEPERDSSDYEKYIEELRRSKIRYQVDFFTGIFQPPPEEEYNRLLYRRIHERNEDDEESDDGSYDTDNDW